MLVDLAVIHDNHRVCQWIRIHTEEKLFYEVLEEIGVERALHDVAEEYAVIYRDSREN